MSARSTLIQLAAKTGMLIAALFVVTVLLAAIPQHKDASGQVVGEPVGDLNIRGFVKRVPAFNLMSLREPRNLWVEERERAAASSEGARGSGT